MTSRETCKPPFCTCGWHTVDHEATQEEASFDYCYYEHCTDHHHHTPPGDPRARHRAVIDFNNRDAKQRMLDKPKPSQDIIDMWSEYMTIVKDDWKSILWGWLYAEQTGLAYYHFDHEETGNAEWRLR